MTFNSVRYTALTIAALSFYLGLAICNFGTAQTEVSASKWFENKQGKLVTVYICKHCEEEKTEPS